MGLSGVSFAVAGDRQPVSRRERGQRAYVLPRVPKVHVAITGIEGGGCLSDVPPSTAP